MKKTEKILTAIALMAFGLLCILLKDRFIGLLMTLVGGGLIVLGVVDIFRGGVALGIVKICSGGLLVLCGWVVVEAVLYVLAGLLLTVGILAVYDKIKRKGSCGGFWRAAWEYAVPALCIAIGTLLLLHRSSMVTFVFVVSGLLTVCIGGLVLAEALYKE